MLYGMHAALRGRKRVRVDEIPSEHCRGIWQREGGGRQTGRVFGRKLERETERRKDGDSRVREAVQWGGGRERRRTSHRRENHRYTNLKLRHTRDTQLIAHRENTLPTPSSTG